MRGTRAVLLSVIVPVFNEQDNIPLLHASISRVLKEQQYNYEVIYVDDGSTDESFTQLSSLASSDPHVHVVKLRRNFGQTAAISAGVHYSTGEILVFMDGDLQNDPVDIPRMLAKLDEGYDVVSGWRKNRKDAQLSRKLPSWLANRLISKVSGTHLHDYGCTLKAYRREVFQHVRLYGEMHRFIPAYAALTGAAIAYVPRDPGPGNIEVSGQFRHQAALCLWHAWPGLANAGWCPLRIGTRSENPPPKSAGESQSVAFALRAVFRVWYAMHHDGIAG